MTATKKVENEKIETQKKVEESKKEEKPVQVPVLVPVAKPEITDEAILKALKVAGGRALITCLLYTSPSPRDRQRSRMPSSA